MQWSEIKTALTYMFSPYVGKLINFTSGSPTELAVYLDLVHGRIVGYPHEWEFLKQTTTISVSGATTYNLATLLPGFLSLYQLWGINQNQESLMAPNYEANIVPEDSYTLRNNTLQFNGTIPVSGTFNVQYKSSYMVKTTGNVLQKYFLNDTDVSVLDDADMNVLLFGAGEFIRRKIDENSVKTRGGGTRGAENKDDYNNAFRSMMLRQKQTNQSHTMF